MRVSDVYNDIELPYLGEKVANKLCIGGPCYYLLHGDKDANNRDNNASSTTTMMTQMFTLRSVVPNM